VFIRLFWSRTRLFCVVRGALLSFAGLFGVSSWLFWIAKGSFESCKSRSSFYRALWSVYMALLKLYVTLLCGWRALLNVYRALLSGTSRSSLINPVFVCVWIFTWLFRVYTGLFRSHTRLFWVCRSFQCVEGSLELRLEVIVDLPPVFVRVWVFTGPFWVSTGLFLSHIGLFWVCRGLFWVCWGFFCVAPLDHRWWAPRLYAPVRDGMPLAASCVYECLYTCICILVHTSECVCMWASSWQHATRCMLCMWEFVHVYMRVCVYECMYVCAYIWVCVHVR